MSKFTVAFAHNGILANTKFIPNLLLIRPTLLLSLVYSLYSNPADKCIRYHTAGFLSFHST